MSFSPLLLFAADGQRFRTAMTGALEEAFASGAMCVVELDVEQEDWHFTGECHGLSDTGALAYVGDRIVPVEKIERLWVFG